MAAEGVVSADAEVTKVRTLTYNDTVFRLDSFALIFLVHISSVYLYCDDHKKSLSAMTTLCSLNVTSLV